MQFSLVRILKPRLDAERIASVPVWTDPVDDYRPLLAHAGFETLSYEQIPHCQDHVNAGLGAVIDNGPVLESELGEAAAAATVLEASITLELQPYCGHVLAVAIRR